MSTHPNAILLLALKPDTTSRKTFRAIMDELGLQEDESIKIGENKYHTHVMESDYAEDFQISAEEGDIIVFAMFTYGYGERIEWNKLVRQQAELKAWSEGICERHKCTAKFFVTANYW